jgi:tetratricopeptide (TPR) repeat protein
MTTFHLYVIHTQRLVHRQPRLHGVIQTIREAAQQAGFDFKPIMILKPDPSHLQPDLQTLNNRIKYDPVGEEEFDKSITMLSIEELSNIEKHREAWRRILKESPEDVFMVIEDDAFVVPMAQQQLMELFKLDQRSYDFNIMCLSDPSANPDASMQLLNLRDTGKILPSKDAYMVSHRLCKKLLEETETIKFTMRVQLSYIIQKNPIFQAKYPSKRIMLEGSKLGLYPSSLHPNNMLIYNQEYMELWKYMSMDKFDVGEVRELYKRIAHIQNPDMLHLYGVLLFKGGRVQEAEAALMEAIELMQKQHGMLTYRSDLLNNLINMQEHLQTDLPDIMSKPSKYQVRS